MVAGDLATDEGIGLVMWLVECGEVDFVPVSNDEALAIPHSGKDQ